MVCHLSFTLVSSMQSTLDSTFAVAWAASAASGTKYSDLHLSNSSAAHAFLFSFSSYKSFWHWCLKNGEGASWLEDCGMGSGRAYFACRLSRSRGEGTVEGISEAAPGEKWEEGISGVHW